MISITTIYQWVNPEDIDNLITEKIEQAIKDIEWISKITSTSAVGYGSTFLEFENNADITQALVDIKDAVGKTNLPSDAKDPIVTELSSDNELMFILLLYGDENELSQMYLRDKARKLKADLDGRGSINRIDIGWTTNGSANVVIWGAWNSNYDVQVLADKNKLEALGLTLLQVSQTIKSWNQNQPLWNHVVGDLAYDFRIQWELKTISELEMIPVQTKNGFVYLKDIAVLEKKLQDDSIKKLWAYGLSGQNYLTLSFNKRVGQNLFKSAEEAKELLWNELKKIEYQGLQYKITYDLSEFIYEDYDDLAKNGLQTILLVFLALLLFIGFKESVIATVTLPLAFFVTFIVLKSLGLSLNFLTNFSLIITFGIAIDTTIVIIEGAHERLRQWFKPKHAILLSVRDYKLPLIAGTSTTLVVFLPLLSLPGVMGKFLAFIPITIFSTLLAALVISLTINSALYYKLSKPRKYFEDKLVNKKYMLPEDVELLESDREWKEEKPKHKKDLRGKILDNIADWYGRLLKKIMTNTKSRFLWIAISLGLFVLSMVVVAPQLGLKLFPSNDNWFMNLTITAQKGTTKEKMSEHAQELEKVLSAVPEIKVYNYEIGGNIINTSIELLTTNQRKEKKLRNVFEIEQILDQDLDILRSMGLNVKVAALEDGPPGWSAVGIKLIANTNDKFDTLIQVAKVFEDYLQNIEGAKNVSISSEESPWQFVFNFDKDRLTLLGISPGDLTMELFAVTNGLQAGSLKGRYDDHDIKLRYQQFENFMTPSDVDALSINTMGWPINIGDVTEYKFSNAIGQINREDTKITVIISAGVEQDAKTNEIQKEISVFAKEYNYPDGVYFEAGGETEENADLLQSMITAFLIALLLIFWILVLQFNSFMQPLIIMFSILMGLFGAQVGLWVTGNPYSLMFMIGFIALTWIVINDAIVFLSRANTNMARWMDRYNAIIEAGKARLHPILLTTITTIVWLSSIVGNTMWQALAVTVMFGIFFWSAMTLFVIPAIYYDRHKIVHLIKRVIFQPIIVFWLFVGGLALLFAMGYLIHIKFWNINNFGYILWWVAAAYLIAYAVYRIWAEHKYGRTFIQKLLNLNFQNSGGGLPSLRQTIKRFLRKKLFFRGPAVLGAISIFFVIASKIVSLQIQWKKPSPETIQAIVENIIQSTVAYIIFGIIWIIYVAVFVLYLYKYRINEHNQGIHDILAWVEVDDPVTEVKTIH